MAASGVGGAGVGGREAAEERVLGRGVVRDEERERGGREGADGAVPVREGRPGDVLREGGAARGRCEGCGARGDRQERAAAVRDGGVGDGGGERAAVREGWALAPRELLQRGGGGAAAVRLAVVEGCAEQGRQQRGHQWSQKAWGAGTRERPHRQRPCVPHVRTHAASSSWFIVQQR